MKHDLLIILNVVGYACAAGAVACFLYGSFLRMQAIGAEGMVDGNATSRNVEFTRPESRALAQRSHRANLSAFVLAVGCFAAQLLGEAL